MLAHGAHNNDPVDYIRGLIAREGRPLFPCSWHTDAGFGQYALARPAFTKYLPDPFFVADLTDEQRRQLKAVLGRIDRFGQAVRGASTLDDCLPGLMDRLAVWLQASVSPSLLRVLGASIIQDMASRLRRSIRTYPYDVDFWAWAGSMLVDEILLRLVARGYCAGGLMNDLTRDADKCLAVVYGTHGIYGVDTQMVAARALLITFRSVGETPISISAATVRDTLRAEIKRFAVEAALPVMDWTMFPAEQEEAELLKRMRLLEEFNRLVRG